MTRDDIIRMARESGMLIPSFRIGGGLALGTCTVPDFERFAAIVAQAERAERDELLAALQRIADGQEMSGVFTFADVVLRYQEIPRAAIARATGEQS